MPWKGPEKPGVFPTLGYVVADFIEDSCVVPDGDKAGAPYRLTDEMLRYLLWHYRIDPESGRFVYRGSQLVRPQKWGKGPFSAAIICAEAGGPVLFDGWDADGEPVGRPWATPWIQVTAVSEDQTDNVWRALVPMIELGDLKADIPDTGETRINLSEGGRIEPVTSAHRSRLGQRITFAVQDETHAWTKRNGGRTLADNQRRNLAGMNGRWMETTNAWDPAETSVAQQTAEAKLTDVFKDHRLPGVGSVRNKQHRKKMLKEVYGDSWWVPLDRIDAEIVDLLERGDAAQAERFFLNRIRTTEDSAFDEEKWKQLADATIVVPDKSLITIGIDGARWEDALAIIATDVRTSHQFVLGIWEQPEFADENYEHPFNEVDGVMVDAMERFDVWRVYIDSQRIEKLVERWQGQWTDKVIVEWFTNRPKPMAYAVRAFTQAINAGDLTHDGDSTFARHIRNAKKQKVSVYDEDHRQMHTVSKDRPMSPNKIDAAPAAILSWEARSDAVSSGVLTKRKQSRAFGF